MKWLMDLHALQGEGGFVVRLATKIMWFLVLAMEL